MSWSDPATLDLLAALVRTELVAWWSALDWMAPTRLSQQVARLASSAHGVAAGDLLAQALHQGAALATTGIALESAQMRTSWLRRAAHTGRTLSSADLDAVTSNLVFALSDNIGAS